MQTRCRKMHILLLPATAAVSHLQTLVTCWGCTCIVAGGSQGCGGDEGHLLRLPRCRLPVAKFLLHQLCHLLTIKVAWLPPTIRNSAWQNLGMTFCRLKPQVPQARASLCHALGVGAASPVPKALGHADTRASFERTNVNSHSSKQQVYMRLP